MAAKKQEGVNGGKIFGMFILIIIAYLIYKAVSKPEEGKGGETGEEIIPGINPNPAVPQVAKIDGNTVFQAKKPYPKSDYVEWIQSLYNSYTKQRKAKGKTPDYPTITVDGVYGPNTANAVYRYLGKYHTSWNEFKTRIDYFKTQL